ncbi:MAG: thioredoxin family protein [Alphaproteobacteria bacterium]|nr:MAG: thioredoxin family protein [Alphaproteobacteria bacterium]
MNVKSAIQLNQDLIDKIFTSDKVTEDCIVDFGAAWCGPCMAFEPIFESAAKKSSIKFYKLNIDENREFATSYGIMTIPTLILFYKGEEKSRRSGSMDEASLLKWIDSVIKEN